MQNRDLEIVWGAGAIADLINLDRRQVYYLLERNLIKAAKRVGGRWVADVAGLKRQFHDYRDEERAA
jgi:hypothetical protein